MKHREIIRTSLAIYLPSLMIQLGSSMAMAFNPLWSKALGADLATIGLITAGMGIGQLIFDIPAGWLGGRVREKPFMFVAIVCIAITALLRSMAVQPWQLLVISIFFGMGVTAWGIGRVTYIRRHVPRHMRGRTMAFMGGIMRVSRMVTPALGGLIVHYFGFRIMYLVQFGFFSAAAILIAIMLPAGQAPPREEHSAGHHLKETFRKNGGSILAAMLGITGLMILRISRNMLVPLWADHIGVGVIALGTITSLGGVVETAMVIPAGNVFDKAGRKWAAVPATAGLALAIAALPLAGGAVSLGVVYCFMCLTNGLGSGINMVISSDLAPRKAAAEFLGIWRFVTDSSMLTGPLLAGYLANVFSLWAAPVAAGGIGIVAALVLLFGMKETAHVSVPEVSSATGADPAAGESPAND